jgi:putative tryptophan/tyrosine transport system substrate-binding protein
MRRRDFIALLGGAAAVLPLAARAQPPAIGFMSARSPEDSTHLLAAFRQELAEGGFVEGQNVAIEFRRQNLNLPRRNSNGRFTSISGHAVASPGP